MGRYRIRLCLKLCQHLTRSLRVPKLSRGTVFCVRTGVVLSVFCFVFCFGCCAFLVYWAGHAKRGCFLSSYSLLQSRQQLRRNPGYSMLQERAARSVCFVYATAARPSVLLLLLLLLQEGGVPVIVCDACRTTSCPCPRVGPVVPLLSAPCSGDETSRCCGVFV